jgi:hypothetical protein
LLHQIILGKKGQNYGAKREKRFVNQDRDEDARQAE